MVDEKKPFGPQSVIDLQAARKKPKGAKRGRGGKNGPTTPEVESGKRRTSHRKTDSVEGGQAKAPADTLPADPADESTPADPGGAPGGEHRDPVELSPEGQLDSARTEGQVGSVQGSLLRSGIGRQGQTSGEPMEGVTQASTGLPLSSRSGASFRPLLGLIMAR